MHKLETTAYALLALALSLSSGTAQATVVRVEWLGEATIYYPDQDPNNNPPVFEEISIPVEGVLEIDLAAARTSENFEQHDLTWFWTSTTSLDWQLQTLPAVDDWLNSSGATCIAWCDLVWNSADPHDGFYLWAESDPDSTWIDLDSDGSGAWGFGVVPWRSLEFGYWEGVVSSSVTTVIPEPTAGLLFSLGLIYLAGMRRRGEDA